MTEFDPDVLYVEDDQQVFNAYTRDLRALPGELLTARRAQEGLDAVVAYFARKPNGKLVVITDKDMRSQVGDTVRSGVELARAIKSSPFGHRTYILLLTGGTLPQDPSLDRVEMKPDEPLQLFIDAIEACRNMTLL